MKKTLITYLFTFVSFFSFAQTLSPSATVSLLTISPGSELYSTFGHSGIRINDPLQGLDIVYNYGAFDFRTQGFYIKFLRGTLPYQISANYFNNEIYGWSLEKRLVKEQILNLTQEQKVGVYAFLIKNYLPENREYAYKFFYDNCSSRLRDVFQKVCGDSLKFSSTLHNDSTYRQWIDKYARKNEKLWADFGMDLAIGEPSDRVTGASGAMFLPDNLMDAFGAAQINRSGKWISFVAQTAELNREVLNGLVKEKELITPNILFWSLFIIVAGMTYFQLKKTNFSLVFDKVLFGIVGLVGWLIVFLWFFTNHGVTENNLNIIWAYPLLFPIAFFLRKKNSLEWLSKHFLAYGIILILLLISWRFLPQEINYSLIPVVLTLATRSFFVWWRLRRKLRSF